MIALCTYILDLYKRKIKNNFENLENILPIIIYKHDHNYNCRIAGLNLMEHFTAIHL